MRRRVAVRMLRVWGPCPIPAIASSCQSHQWIVLQAALRADMLLREAAQTVVALGAGVHGTRVFGIRR